MVKKLTLLVLFFFGSLFATTYYVNDVNGNDSYDGLSPDHPFKTIQRALDFLSAGDSCIVYPGNYEGRVVISTSGQSNAPITFLAENSGVVTQGFTIDNVNHINIIGFEIYCYFRTFKIGIFIFKIAVSV